jgi:hypothetical protein
LALVRLITDSARGQHFSSPSKAKLPRKIPPLELRDSDLNCGREARDSDLNCGLASA